LRKEYKMKEERRKKEEERRKKKEGRRKKKEERGKRKEERNNKEMLSQFSSLSSCSVAVFSLKIPLFKNALMMVLVANNDKSQRPNRHGFTRRDTNPEQFLLRQTLKQRQGSLAYHSHFGE
jgi:CRISPR/Cas system-associated endonuclease Cas3-HD